ncbi:MAG TPA: protein kinase [Planctomycetota bacterium]|nr:protein kinase [Planctomycetota bacterium]
MTQPQSVSLHDSRTGIFPEVRGFKITEELARTPRGIVYKARRLVENDIVALKIFRRNVCDKVFIDKLSKNAEGTFILEHSGLVKSLGCIVDNNDPAIAGRILLITEFVQGQSLAKILKEGKPLAPSRALLAALQCTNALQYAASHKRFHGRLHPEDIILGGSNARVLSVGLGERPEHPAWAIKDPYAFEPLIYSAPEALPSQKYPETALDLAAADIYGLGAILFHMLTGKPPFKGTDEAALVAERKDLKNGVEWPASIKLPDEAIRVTERMLAPTASERPAYEKLIPMLTDALFAAEKAESASPKPVESPQFAKPGAAPLPQSNLGHSGALGGVRAAQVGSAPVTPPKATVEVRRSTTPRGAFPAISRSATRNNGALSWALVAMTAIVFVIALVVVITYQPQAQPVVIPQQPPQQPSTPVARPLQPAAPNTPVAPAPAPQPAPAPATLTPPPVASSKNEQQMALKQFELIEDMLKRGELKHTTVLLKMVKGIAETVGKDTPTGLKAVLLAAEIEETLVKNFGAPPGAAQTVAANPAPPAPVEPAKVDDVAAKEAERKAAEEKAAKHAEELALQKSVFAGALKSAHERAAKFQYAEVLAELEKMSVPGDTKKLVAMQIDLVKQEQDFFQRCRKRLVEEIERSPKKESPLQVFPRKNDPQGDDIVDFDAKGLVIFSRKGPKIGKNVTEWEKVPAAQALVLLQLLSDKKSLDDQSAIAIFAFHRNLAEKSEVALEAMRNLNNGKEKADALAETFKEIRGAATVPAPEQK